MNTIVTTVDGGYSCAFVADPHKAMATTVLVRLRPQSAPDGIASATVIGVLNATLGRSGGQLV